MNAELTSLFAGLCDDAAVFPPGSLPLVTAIPAHSRHQRAAHARLVGPFVLSAGDLDDLRRALDGASAGSFRLSLTSPLALLPAALAAVDDIAAVHLEALEVSLPEDVTAAEVVPLIRAALGAREVAVFVELTRDSRRPAIVAALAGTPYMAKLRTGGVRADLYPDEAELAAAIAALVAADVPFKATAGLHHALRNTDAATGFEQHGFLNLLAATGAAMRGATEEELAEVLSVRDPHRVSVLVRNVPPSVRRMFRAFGTCSVAEPVAELVELALIDARMEEDLA